MGAPTRRARAYSDSLPPGLMDCRHCKRVLPDRAFGKNDRNTLRRGLRTWCNECTVAYQATYSRRPGEMPGWTARAESYLKARYGITAAEYNAIFEAQDGVCAGCGRPPGRARLHVDHEHRPNDKRLVNGELRPYVRGLLCSTCNRILGWARDDAQLLANLAGYLTKPPAHAILKTQPRTHEERKHIDD